MNKSSPPNPPPSSPRPPWLWIAVAVGIIIVLMLVLFRRGDDLLTGQPASFLLAQDHTNDDPRLRSQKCFARRYGSLHINGSESRLDNRRGAWGRISPNG
jgi:hypothetical protein